jgi:hypothetical protein
MPADGASVASSSTPSTHLTARTIHIELRQARVRIEGNADAALLRVLLESLDR